MKFSRKPPIDLMISFVISDTPFTMQSCSKPFTYGICLNELGDDTVHRFIGHEPSGKIFNEICLDSNCKFEIFGFQPSFFEFIRRKISKKFEKSVKQDWKLFSFHALAYIQGWLYVSTRQISSISMECLHISKQNFLVKCPYGCSLHLLITIFQQDLSLSKQ